MVDRRDGQRRTLEDKMKSFAQHAQDLHCTPAEVVGAVVVGAVVVGAVVVGAVVAAASTEAINEALQAAFDSPEAFEAAWSEDSCYALDLLEIELPSLPDEAQIG